MLYIYAKTVMETIDTSRFPRKANMAKWMRILNISRPTMLRAIEAGLLSAGYRHLNGRDRILTKEEILSWLEVKPPGRYS
jgi:hypothetical protein